VLGSLLYRSGLPILVAQVVGYAGWAAALVGRALLIETLLRLRREAGDAPGIPDALVRSLYWTAAVAGVALSLAGPFLARMFGFLGWGMFAFRALIQLTFAGVIGALAPSVFAALRSGTSPVPASAGNPEAAVDAALSAALRARAIRNLVIGAVWAAIGTGVTVVSLALTRAGGGGRFVVAFGAIAVGVVQMVRGLIQLMQVR